VLILVNQVLTVLCSPVTFRRATEEKQAIVKTKIESWATKAISTSH